MSSLICWVGVLTTKSTPESVRRAMVAGEAAQYPERMWSLVRSFIILMSSTISSGAMRELGGPGLTFLMVMSNVIGVGTSNMKLTLRICARVTRVCSLMRLTSVGRAVMRSLPFAVHDADLSLKFVRVWN